MAATKIALTKVPLNSGVALPTLMALTADGGEIAFTGMDTKTVILVENSAAAAGEITFKAGSGIQGVADLTVSVPASATLAFVLESGAFKSKGVVKVAGATTMKVGALLLP